MKKFLVLLFTSFLILGACSNKDSSSENSNKSSINKSDKKKKDRSKEKKKEYKKNSSSKENQTSQEQAHLQQDITQVPQQTQQRYDYDHNGVYRTPAEQKAHEQWIKDQVEWNKQNETRKQKLQDEYFNLSDKMYEDGVSKAEYNSMENVKMKY